ncbi:MAG: 16S rRNA (uracil(1498)-N(3))-methyltransferase [Cardiobacteriaceae bacterium]|nr:16S rRNA (uracil(1498)-N(3))-methyltransferase [Cardiobacteriaceae bacterium]
MREFRLFQPALPGDMPQGMTFDLDEAGHHHIARVLRRRVGDHLVLFNGDGLDYAVEIVSMARQHTTVALRESHRNERESPLDLALCLAWLKNDAMDRSLQKAVELGVNVIRPMLVERGEAALDGERLVKKMAHWQGIVQAAACQCGRAVLPQLHEPQPFARAMEACGGARWIASPWHESPAVGTPAQETPLAVAIGAEGGFSDSEVALAVSLGWQPFTLGKRILRADTAVIAALTRAQLLHGDF